jgi:hypothetical protein
MLLTADLVVLLDTSGGVVGNARADHPLAIFRVRLRPRGVDRRIVPLRDRGQRGGVASALWPR